MQGEFVRMQFEIHSTLSGREDHGSVSLENEVDKLQLSGTMFLQFQAHVCYSAKAVQRTRYSPVLACCTPPERHEPAATCEARIGFPK